MGEPFTTDFKITTREPSFVLQNAEQDEGKLKAHSSSKYMNYITSNLYKIIYNIKNNM